MVVPRSRITFSLPVKVTSPLLFYPHFLSVPYVEATLGCDRHPTALKVIQRRLGFVQFLIDPYLLYSREVGRYYIEVLPYRGIPVGLYRALGHIQFTISLLYAEEAIGLTNGRNCGFTRDFRQTRAALHFTSLRLLQPLNTLDPIEDTFSGSVIDDRLVQSLNAFHFIIVTLRGIDTDSNPVQPENKSLFIDGIPSGRITERSPG